MSRTVECKLGKIWAYLLGLLVLVSLTFLAIGVFYGGTTIHKLFAENERLKKAITNLTDEGRIGYAKVLSREVKNGKRYTQIRFIETARDNELERILEKDYTIEGDIVHFDALVVKFGNQMVMDGKKRALYLWRRVYGENTPPSKGHPIESSGSEPKRYEGLLKDLRMKDRYLFWSSIWELANDPEKLKKYDIDAIYGNVTYSKLREGLIYVFKISPTGQVYPEVIPDI